MSNNTVKKAKLLDDEFNPHGAIKPFIRVPRAIAALPDLSLGAKLLYGELITSAGTYGTAYITREALQKALGGASFKTIYNWQRELEEQRLIRVHQKGRGLPNNYYFLRTPLLNNADEWEYAQGRNHVYRGPQVTKPTAMPVEIARTFYQEDVAQWYHYRLNGKDVKFPKPSWRVNRNDFRRFKKQWEDKVKAELATLQSGGR